MTEFGHVLRGVLGAREGSEDHLSAQWIERTLGGTAIVARLGMNDLLAPGTTDGGRGGA